MRKVAQQCFVLGLADGRHSGEPHRLKQSVGLASAQTTPISQLSFPFFFCPIHNFSYALSMLRHAAVADPWPFWRQADASLIDKGKGLLVLLRKTEVLLNDLHDTIQECNTKPPPEAGKRSVLQVSCLPPRSGFYISVYKVLFIMTDMSVSPVGSLHTTY